MFKWSAAGVALALAVAPPVRAQGADPTLDGKPASAWLKDLAGQDDDAHEKAATVLATAGKSAVPALIKALQNGRNATLRERAAEVLGLIGEDAGGAVPELIKALKDKTNEVRAAAATALGGIGPGAKAAVPELIKMLKNADDAQREHAAAGLGGIGPDAKDAVPELIRA